jgi:hypothetical protein
VDALGFWLGDWACTWEGGSGTNTVSRELGGAVIVERFESLEPERWQGLSVTVPDPRTGIWRQTWVDSNGSYWHLEGGPRDDGSFVLGTPERVDRDQRFKRMVFSAIEPHGFDWRWETSADGTTWEGRWAIRYQRR